MARQKIAGAWETVEGWYAGRAWRDSDGTRTFYIRKQIGGRRYDVSTRASTLPGALEQLRRFEADPERYDPRGSEVRDPIFLDETLTKAFLRWSKEKGNSARWRGQQKAYLAWWAERLRGVDLRRCFLRDHVLPALDRPDGKTCRPQRIAVVKVLFAWLRKERHDITTAEDPTFGQLSVPQAKPEQLKRPKAVPAEHVALVIGHLATDRWRDLLRVLAGTGMHVSELERFAASGTIEPLPRDGRAEGAAGVVVIQTTKAGDPLRVAVGPEVLEAAKRVLVAGPFDRQKLTKAIHAACAVVKRPDGEIGIPTFGPGQLRHSVATAAVNAGTDPAVVSAFLGHKSPRTTRRFYATLATPAKVPTLL